MKLATLAEWQRLTPYQLLGPPLQSNRTGGSVRSLMSELVTRESLARALVTRATEWAKLDRACDDRAAELNQIEEQIVAIAPRTSEALQADRDGAVIKLRDARAAKDDAEERLREAARELTP